MIRYYAKVDGKIKELEKRKTSCWVNISPPFSQEELEELAQELLIPLDFLTDSLDIDERSRYEREEDHRLIVLNTPILNEVETENEAIYFTVPIGVILTPEHVVTITSFENPVLQQFLDEKVKHFNPSNDSLFALQIMEQTVFRFLLYLKKLNNERNQIEKELYDDAGNRSLRQLLRVEKSLVYFVNALSANELLKMKMKRTDFLTIRHDEDQTDLFEDIIIDNTQALEMANTYTNILSGTMDAVASIISNNLNIVIQRLTLVTIILMVPTLVASFYGMNVDLPWKDNPNAFYFILITSIAVSLALAWFFRRKRMF